MNHVVRMISRKSNTITTIAGNHHSVEGKSNNPEEKDPLKLNLPAISSMDYWNGHLFIPTDLTAEEGELAVLRKQEILIENHRAFLNTFLFAT